MGTHVDTSPVEPDVLRRACGFCSLRELCWPMDLDPSDLERLQSAVGKAGPLPAGSCLFRVGDQFTAIYAVRTGCIKSYSLDAGGHERVHGFHLRGELLGFDAVYPDRHRCNAVVLESSSVCVLPHRDIARLRVEFHSLNSQILQLMNRELSRQFMFGESSDATRRIAAFLWDIYSRLHVPDSTEYEFRLPMSREDISNYLGISPETLSRLLTKLRGTGMIDIDRRQIRLVDPIGLDQIAQGMG